MELERARAFLIRHECTMTYAEIERITKVKYQILKQMYDEHVADIKNRPGYAEREADRQRRYGGEYQRKRRGAYKKQNRPELALRTAESKY